MGGRWRVSSVQYSDREAGWYLVGSQRLPQPQFRDVKTCREAFLKVTDQWLFEPQQITRTILRGEVVWDDLLEPVGGFGLVRVSGRRLLPRSRHKDPGMYQRVEVFAYPEALIVEHTPMVGEGDGFRVGARGEVAALNPAGCCGIKPLLPPRGKATSARKFSETRGFGQRLRLSFTVHILTAIVFGRRFYLPARASRGAPSAVTVLGRIEVAREARLELNSFGWGWVAGYRLSLNLRDRSVEGHARFGGEGCLKLHLEKTVSGGPNAAQGGSNKAHVFWRVYGFVGVSFRHGLPKLVHVQLEPSFRSWGGVVGVEGLDMAKFGPMRIEPTLSQHCERILKKVTGLLVKFMSNWVVGYVKRVHHDVILPKVQYQDGYQLIKDKFQHWVGQWPEATDPSKFVFEELGIATFLHLLWGAVEFRSTSFVDVGCGNGFLTHVLSELGHAGRGVDQTSRKIWARYPQTTRLEARTILPASQTYPEEWLVGNHCDELTPWVPVMAALSGYDSKFLLLPCCYYDFDGAKYSKVMDPGVGRYENYTLYLQWIMSRCGYVVEKEYLRIPSTKNLAWVGRRRTFARGYQEAIRKQVLALIEGVEFQPRVPDREKQRHTMGGWVERLPFISLGGIQSNGKGSVLSSSKTSWM
ncbi:tRNA(Ser) Um(44) 2'-O-methyltransferase [Massospora cicadina]|nr:tRNA(Ser) Um(44) 2'-O-methyltransferase [Massospora cicadina]